LLWQPPQLIAVWEPNMLEECEEISELLQNFLAHPTPCAVRLGYSYFEYSFIFPKWKRML
jgi:hypothetical protein